MTRTYGFTQRTYYVSFLFLMLHRNTQSIKYTLPYLTFQFALESSPSLSLLFLMFYLVGVFSFYSPSPCLLELGSLYPPSLLSGVLCRYFRHRPLCQRFTTIKLNPEIYLKREEFANLRAYTKITLNKTYVHLIVYARK